jgi:hypothetical protein
MTESKNDVAWKQIFEKYEIIRVLEQSNYFGSSVLSMQIANQIPVNRAVKPKIVNK